MSTTRFVILHNSVPEISPCPCCQEDYQPPAGYIVVAMRADQPASACEPVCPDCVRKQEPGLQRMIELDHSYRKYEMQMTELGRQGALDPSKRP